jgi:hypothetical protein
MLLSWLAVCTLAVGGCAAIGPAPLAPELPPLRADTIARLRVDGPNAFINGRQVRGGNYVLDGDTVSTGPGTSAILVLNDGGEIQLDQDTDPLFRQGVCLLMKILRGRAALHNTRCQEFEDGVKMAGVARSFIHIDSQPDASRLTVIEGQVEMHRPSQEILGRNTQYVARADGTVERLQLTPEEAIGTVAWTRNFFRPRAAPQGEGMSPVAAGAIGLTIGGLVDYFLKNKRVPRPREPVPAPQTQPRSETVPPARNVPGRID